MNSPAQSPSRAAVPATLSDTGGVGGDGASVVAAPSKKKNRLFRRTALSFLSILFALLAWIQWGSWPNPPEDAISWIPDVIVVLGGGDQARSREAIRWHQRYPDVPILITGDGGQIRRQLLDGGVTEASLLIEDAATSTRENALYISGFLEALHAERVVIVTNWFHVPRSLAVFRHYHSGCVFAAAFEPEPAVLSKWDTRCERRERLAACWYFVRYGINSGNP